MGLGVDESYMVAAGRHIHAGYYDHPPLAWWLSWAAATVLRCDAPLAVRSPFILLFAASTWLMFQYTASLFSRSAGCWAAYILNVVPVLGVSTATFVLPDGPMVTALLGMGLCLAKAESSTGGRAWTLWLAAGVLAGLALDSKYIAIFSLAGAVTYFAVPGRRGVEAPRRWLTQPHPYAAALIAFALFVPVLVWNARNHWISFAFQGGRIGGRFHPFGLLSAFLTQAVVMLPWLLIPLLICAAGAWRAGPTHRAQWLPLCLGLPPVAFFLAISPWTHVLPHWPAPGFALLLPLLGAAITRHRTSAWLRGGLIATGIFTVVGATFVGSEVRFNWLPKLVGDFPPGTDPNIQLMDWRSLKPALLASGFLKRPNTVVAGLRWHEAAKIDYALGGSRQVICLCRDSREYGLTAAPDAFKGQDVVLVTTHANLDTMKLQFGALFSSIDELQPIVVMHFDRPAMILPVFLGHALRIGMPEQGSAK